MREKIQVKYMMKEQSFSSIVHLLAKHLTRPHKLPEPTSSLISKVQKSWLLFKEDLSTVTCDTLACL